MNKYADIINLDRPKSKRPSMSMEARAAQFAPFSALTGYEESIKESSRITDKKKDISEGIKEIINEKLNYIKKNNYNGIITLTYFIKDKSKSGGSYKKIDSSIKKVDISNELIVLNDGSRICFDDIYSIDGDVFNYLDV